MTGDSEAQDAPRMHALLLCMVSWGCCLPQESHVLQLSSCHLRRPQKGVVRHGVLGLTSMICTLTLQVTAVPAL